MDQAKIIIGTRGSALALWQANTVAALLDCATELAVIKTAGDRFLDIKLQGQPDMGFFTREIEERLLAGAIDAAVHSLKDLPTEDTPGLALAAMLPRAAVSDLLLIHPDWHDPSQLLPARAGCQVGATSLRRQALLKLHGPQCAAAALRGNVPTRVDKCRAGEFGAIVLARAGVERLGLDLGELVAYELNPELWPPAPGQGIIAVQVRAEDQPTRELVARLDDADARQAASVERGVMANFAGGCHTAFAAWASADEAHWRLRIGVEEAAGWGQCTLRGSLEELRQIRPDNDKLAFSALVAATQEELCRQIQL